MAQQKDGNDPKIAVQEVFKIFGPDPQSVLEDARNGMGKEEMLEKTGHTVGIRDISLDIMPGETFVIMGLSGSGKSTLIRHFNRLIEPTSGRILVDGEDVLKMNPADLLSMRRRQMSMVFQRFALLPHKTVLENVSYGLEVAGVARDEARQRAAKQIELVGLGGFENQFPRQLSGGMQQRVGLARALATDAEILLMDEAFSALDPLIRNDMQDQLLDLQQKLHKTIVFITHDLDEALRLGDHIAILKDGALSQVGTGEEILLHPADDYVARFVKDVNRGRVVTVGSIVQKPPTLALSETDPSRVSKAMDDSGERLVYVLDEHKRLAGVITRDMLDGADGAKLQQRADLAEAPSVGHDTVIEEMLPLMTDSDVPVAVVDDDGQFLGAVSRRSAVTALVRRGEVVTPD